MLLPAVRFKTLCSCVFGSCINFLQGFQQFLLLPEQKSENLSTNFTFRLNEADSDSAVSSCLSSEPSAVRINIHTTSSVWALCSGWMCTWGPSAWFSASPKTRCCDPFPGCWGAVSCSHSGFLCPRFKGNKIMRQWKLYKKQRKKKNQKLFVTANAMSHHTI